MSTGEGERGRGSSSDQWLAVSETGAGRVDKLVTDGSSKKLPYDADPLLPYAMAYRSALFVTVFQSDGKGGGIQRADLNDGQHQTLYLTASASYGIATDSTYVYWTELGDPQANDMAGVIAYGPQ